MGQYALRQSNLGEVICYQWFTQEEAEFWSKLLRAQAEKAWEEGAEAEAQTWPDCAVACGGCGQCRLPAPGNPYTAEAQVDGL